MRDPAGLARPLVLLAVANYAPILARTLLGDRFATPIDLDRTLGDGRPVFGRGKTFRGLAASCAATTLVAPALRLAPATGLALAAASLTGDLASSFAKRRLGLPAHAQAFGLDQVPEALLPLLVLRRRLALGPADIAATVALFTVGEVVLARLFHRLGLRDRPY
ncbi:CDP-archaeol synthase [Methylobacterium currus]|uniref:CDP-archaeol synthase n=1 Tax=Methylobacterium currus TaxID=2051553 RepID=UPI001E4DD25C|nr:CDP-archaeol synthase [Methylobacterium currus]UHC17593.1 CDP-archaeol synthase [Methylobacterium currus]